MHMSSSPSPYSPLSSFDLHLPNSSPCLSSQSLRHLRQQAIVIRHTQVYAFRLLACPAISTVEMTVEMLSIVASQCSHPHNFDGVGFES